MEFGLFRLLAVVFFVAMVLFLMVTENPQYVLPEHKNPMYISILKNKHSQSHVRPVQKSKMHLPYDKGFYMSSPETPMIDTPMIDTPIIDTPMIDTPMIDTQQRAPTKAKQRAPTTRKGVRTKAKQTPRGKQTVRYADQNRVYRY